MYSKIPFIVGKSYICQRDDMRSADSFFELGKVYQCVKIKHGDKYCKTFILDDSVVVFLTDNGKEISYSGSTADSYFSSNPEKCAEIIDNEITYIQNRIDNDIIEIQDLEDQILALKRANDNRCEIQNILNTRKSEILNTRKSEILNINKINIKTIKSIDELLEDLRIRMKVLEWLINGQGRLGIPISCCKNITPEWIVQHYNVEMDYFMSK